MRLRCNAPTFLADNDVIITWSRDSSGEKDTITKGQENGSKSSYYRFQYSLAFAICDYCRILHLSTVFKNHLKALIFTIKNSKRLTLRGYLWKSRFVLGYCKLVFYLFFHYFCKPFFNSIRFQCICKLDFSV